MNKRVALFLLLGISSAAHAADMRVARSLALTNDKNGFVGSIHLLVDARLSDSKLANEKDCQLADDPVFKKKPPAQARLQLVDQFGTVHETEQLEKPIASIRGIVLPTGYEMFQVTVDNYACFGSYSGLGTQFLRVLDGKFQWVEAEDAKQAFPNASNSGRL